MAFPVLGTVQLGMPYGVANRSGQPDRATAFRILEAAVNEGINSFDTAAAYGTSEEILGEFIWTHGLQDRVQVISKIAPGESVDASLRRLRLPSLDVLLLHRFDSDSTQTLHQFRGVARLLGMSVYEAEEAAAVLRELDVVQVPLWSAGLSTSRQVVESSGTRRLDDSSTPAPKRVDVRSIFLQGLIAMHEPPAHLREITPFVKTLDKLGDRLELCVTFARDLEGVGGVLFGAETADQVREFARRWKAPPMSVETRAAITEAIARIPADVLDPRKWNGKLPPHAAS